jgi:hypothetical protein
MSNIRHLARGYEFYFRDPSYLKQDRDRLYFVGDIRDMRAALAGIFAPVPMEVIDELYRKIHVASTSSAGFLVQYPDDQLLRMRNAVANEYAIYDRLMDMAQRHRHHSSVEVPAIAGGRSAGLERSA